MMKFQSREQGATELAKALSLYQNQDLVVVGLARGGIIAARVVADALMAPMIPLIVRRIGAPWDPDYSIGAVSEDGTIVREERPVQGVDDGWWRAQEMEKHREAQSLRESYGGAWTPSALAGKNVIIVDDGLTTGRTMEAAIESVKNGLPMKIVVAVPVAALRSCHRLEDSVDEIVSSFFSEDALHVKWFYEDFPPADDAQVRDALLAAPSRG